MLAPLATTIAWLALAVRIDAPPPIDAGTEADPTDTDAGALPDGNPPRFGTAQAPPVRLGAKILYVNFDGGEMNSCGNDNPQDNCSTIFGGVVLPYSGDAAKRAAVIQIIRNRVEDFGIAVTNQRPAQGDYDMEMVGNWQGQQPGFAGIAPNIDCFDNDGGEVSFTLESSGTPDGIAEIVLQEAAHTWGLEHVNDGGDLLFPTTSGTNKTFVDECFKIVSDTSLNESNGICNQVHTEFCNSGWQNSYRELLFVFGESVADTIAPTLVITEPADGAQIGGESDGDFDVVVDIADDQTPVVLEVTLTISGDALPEPAAIDGAYAGPSTISFPIDGLPDGEYTVLVEGLDESGNPASDQVTVTISTAGPSDTSSATGPTEDTSGGPVDPTNPDPTTPDPGTDDGNDDSESSGSGEATPVADSGCACRTTTSSAHAFAWLALASLVRRRRRSLRSSAS